MNDRPYVVLGSVWLLTALILRLGQSAVRYQPTRYAFFGVGGWLSPAAYWLLIVVCIAVGLVFVSHRKHV
jgi:hypothetical protein